MCKVNMYELKTNLSKYINMLEKGEEEEIVIMRYDKMIATISLYKETKKTKRIGGGIGVLEKLPFDLDDSEVNEEIAKDFGM